MGSDIEHWAQGDDTAVAARLRSELVRLRAAESPLERLGCSPDTMRERFLTLTKELHPNRFARRSEEVRTLAGEVYLLIKDAYERESRDKPKGIDTQALSSRLDEAKAEARSRRARTRTSTVSPDSSARKEQLERRKEKLKTQLADSPKRTAQIRAATSPSSEEIEVVNQEEQDFRAAVKLMEAGNFSEAADAFRALAVARPTEKRFRSHMHYTQGRVKQAEGKQEDAISEYKRALGLNPSFAPALEAMNSAKEQGKKKGGFLSKLFGKS